MRGAEREEGVSDLEGGEVEEGRGGSRGIMAIYRSDITGKIRASEKNVEWKTGG